MPGKGTESAAPVRLISNKGALRLLGSFADIDNSGIRRRLIQLVDEIAKATRKTKTAGRSERVA